MKWIGNRRYRLRAALAAGLAAVMLGQIFPKEPAGMWISPGASQHMCGWWGTMYPKFCFAKGGTGEESDEVYTKNGKRGKVKVSFWLAKAFDW